MRVRNFLAVVGLLAAGSAMFTSCIERDDYNSNPNNNNYNHGNNTNSDTTYALNVQFSQGKNSVWSFISPTDSAYAGDSGGTYQYVDYSTQLSSTTTLSTGANVQNNLIITTQIKSNNKMGLIFGASATSNGYAFYIDTAGNYSLYEEGSGTTASTAIIPSTQDTLYALKDNWNTIEMDQVNGVWTFYINGTQVTSMAARSLSGSNFGFKVLPETIGYASYLTVKSW